MAKSTSAFRTISEVSDWLGVPPHVLRFWESKFTQIKPVKRAGGRRYYRPEDMALLGGIRMLLHEQGMTIKGAQKVLREKGIKHVIALGPDPIEDPSFEEAVGNAATTPPAADAPLTQTAMTEEPAAPAKVSPIRPRSSFDRQDAGIIAILASASPAGLKKRASRILPLAQRLAALADQMA